MSEESFGADQGSRILEATILERLVSGIASKLGQRLESLAPQHTPAKRLFTVAEAAQYLGRSENAVKLLIHRGKLPVTKIDTKSQIDKDALDKLIDDCTYYEAGRRN